MCRQAPHIMNSSSDSGWPACLLTGGSSVALASMSAVSSFLVCWDSLREGKRTDLKCPTHVYSHVTVAWSKMHSVFITSWNPTVSLSCRCHSPQRCPPFWLLRDLFWASAWCFFFWFMHRLHLSVVCPFSLLWVFRNKNIAPFFEPILLLMATWVISTLNVAGVNILI